MADSLKQHMQCMEVWGGSQLTSSEVELAGLDVWVYSKPFGEARRGRLLRLELRFRPLRSG